VRVLCKYYTIYIWGLSICGFWHPLGPGTNTFHILRDEVCVYERERELYFEESASIIVGLVR
jgi:hypothetical protein